MRVKTPATSANLGPGYDSFGLALNLFNEYKFYRGTSEKFSISIKDPNNNKINFKNENNLILQTLLLLNNNFKNRIDPKKIKIEVKLNYPLERGLGSSANAIIATICGINNLFSLDLNKKEILELALKIEGHPDNIVPALLGGFTISKVQNNKLNYEKFTVSKELNILLFIPELAIKTNGARQIIANDIDIKFASQNIANASLITAGFIKNDLKLIKKGAQDYLHQKKRLSLNKKLEIYFDKLEKNIEIPFFLSGSGSTIIFISKQDFNDEKKIIKTMAKDLGIINYLIETDVNNEGTLIN